MKYTPIYQIPYLEGSDKLSMLAAASQEQATGVESALRNSSVPPAGSDLLTLIQRMNTLEDHLDELVGPWQPLTVTGATGTIRIRREVDNWHLQFDITFASSLNANQAANAFAFVPSNARPATGIALAVSGWATGPATGSVSTDGSVSLRNTFTSPVARFVGFAIWPA